MLFTCLANLQMLYCMYSLHSLQEDDNKKRKCENVFIFKENWVFQFGVFL